MALLLSGCNDDDACDRSPIEANNFETLFGCSNTAFDMGVALENDFTLISSQEQFDDEVTGFCRPELDYASVDLIIGRTVLNRGFQSVSYTYNRACPTRRYELRVLFTLTDEVVSPTVTYHVVVPKIAETEAVDVRIEVR